MDELVRQTLFRMSARLDTIVHRLDAILVRMEQEEEFTAEYPHLEALCAYLKEEE